jgi:hypothetical protein
MTFPAEKIEGAVERVTFHSEETGFCVLQVKARSHDDLVTIVGHLPNIVPGEWVQATGAWVKDRKHGTPIQSRTAQVCSARFDRGHREVPGVRTNQGHRADLCQPVGGQIRQGDI